MNIRLKFKKEGPIRFVGHLDLMRTFQKIFRRAGIPIAYSEGFSPHQIFSFASALAVGVSSEGEYMDLKLTEDILIDDLIKMINDHSPLGIQIIEGVILQNKEPAAMASVMAAKYKIIQYNQVLTSDIIDYGMNQESLIIQKKTKKGKINDIDLKPGILTIKLEDSVIWMTLATGSHFNIKPEMVLTKLLALKEITFERGDYLFHRIDIYRDQEGLTSLLVTKLGL